VHERLLAELGGDTGSAPDRALVAFARRLSFAPSEVADALADLREHFTDDEAHDAIAVVGLMSLANRAALATGITEEDDL
jgi:alkylhydroperoxidase family enzyme